MTAEEWRGLVPLILGSAIEPIEIAITIMLLASPARLRAAGSWIGGHIVTRLVQGVIFGTILHWGARMSHQTPGRHVITATILSVVALLFLVTAARALLTGDDPDKPPPKWMTMLTSATPTKAFLIGIGVMAVSVKAWVLTLAAIGVIGTAGSEAGLGRVSNAATYLAFVALAASGNLLVIGVAALLPGRSRALLEATLSWITRNDRYIVIGVGLVFGIWFGIKSLRGFEIL